MSFYEIYLELLSGSKRIGKTCIQLQSKSRFQAALLAERIINGRYGENVYCRTLKVSSITEDEFLYQLAA